MTEPRLVPPPSGRLRLVVDASALLALILDPGPRTDAIAELIAGAELVAGSELHAPHLLPFEMSNVLRRQRLAGRITPGQAEEFESALSRLPLELWPHETVAARVRELGDVLTAYDASYVAVAELLGATLVTMDQRLAGAPGVRCEIRSPG